MSKRVIATEKPDLSLPLDLGLLSKLVRHKRSSMGITLENAASLCGLSKQAYNNVEKGCGNIRVQTLFIVLEAFGIKLSVLEQEEDDVWV
ncbi:MAG: XRE family transcriptional regulator [Gammaproteobacteria bacterium]|nr:MAG: XRE family transcriptional regulator [Gammaproteobacteria bacterium]